MSYNLIMELKSDCLPGTTIVNNTFINRDILFDEYGLPVISSRRIKGVLRKNADLLNKIGLLEHRVCSLFGKAHGEMNVIKILDGYLINHTNYQKIFNKHKNNLNNTILNRNAVIPYFSYIRPQISIDLKTGSCKEQHLLQSRVLRKGLIFKFKIDFPKEFYNDFQKICKITRHFGTSRNRGLGEIKLILSDVAETSQKIFFDFESSISNSIEENKTYTLKYHLKNIQPLIINHYIDYNYKSLEFIPGTLILGALAYLFRKKKQINNAHEDEEFYSIFLNQDVIFTNAFPVDQYDNFYTKCPSNYNLTKYGNELVNNFDLNGFQDNKESYKSINQLSVILNEGITLRLLNLEHQNSVHITTQKFEKNLFFYDSIPPMIFKGEIIAKGNVLKNLINNLNLDTETISINIGKSKSAQYGQCFLKLKEFKKINEDEELVLNENENFFLYFESDLILLNKFGFDEINKKTFEQNLVQNYPIFKDKFSIVQESIKVKRVGGFSGILRTDKPHYNCISAGSIYFCEIKEKIKINAKNERLRIGIKQEEGFGSIRIIRNMNFSKITYENNFNHSLGMEIPNSNDNSVIKLLEFVSWSYFVKKLEIYVDNLMDYKKNMFNISNSFLEKLSFIIKECINFAKLYEKIQTYLKNESDNPDNQFKKAFTKIKEKLFFLRLDTNAEELEKNFSNFLETEEIIHIKPINFEKQNKIWIKELINRKNFDLYQIYCLRFLKTLKLGAGRENEC